MGWQVRVKTSLEIRPPPLPNCIPDLPFLVAGLRAVRLEQLIQYPLKAFDLIFVVLQPATRPAIGSELALK